MMKKSTLIICFLLSAFVVCAKGKKEQLYGVAFTTWKTCLIPVMTKARRIMSIFPTDGTSGMMRNIRRN